MNYWNFFPQLLVYFQRLRDPNVCEGNSTYNLNSSMRKESSEGSETEAQHHLPQEGERKTDGHTPPHYVGKEAWQEVEVRATGSEPLSKHGETMLQSSGFQL